MKSSAGSSSKYFKVKEKKKSRHSDKTMDESGAEKTLKDPTKFHTAIDIDTINCIVDQLPADCKISESIASYLADDVTIKIRDILQTSKFRTRHLKRKNLKVCDIDSAMASASIERIYGPSVPEWNQIGENYTIEDQSINLVELAFNGITLNQDGPPYITNEWLSLNATEENKYFDATCNAVFSENSKLSRIALHNLKINRRIGTLINQFVTFCLYAYFIDKTDKSLILKMLKHIAKNPCSKVTRPEKGIFLLATVLTFELIDVSEPKDLSRVERMRRDIRRRELKEDISNTLILMINCWPSLEPLVLERIETFMSDRKKLPRSAVYLIVTRGLRVTKALFWNTFLESITLSDLEEENWRCNGDKFVDYEMFHSLWFVAMHVFRTLSFDIHWERCVSTILGDVAVPIYPNFGMFRHSTTIYPARKKIIFTRTNILKCYRNTRPASLEDAFEDYKPINRTFPIIQYGNYIHPASSFSGFFKEEERNVKPANSVLIMKKPFVLTTKSRPTPCYSHALLFSL